MALTGAVNRPCDEYLYKKLLNPLGFTSESKNLMHGDSNQFGYCCPYATSRNYAAFGQMLSEE